MRFQRATGCTGKPSFRPRLERLEDRRLLAAGDLDPTFGMASQVTTDFQGPADSSGQALAVQPDGKIVMVGGPEIFNARGWFLTRYNPDGSLDPTFGSGGLVSNTVGLRANAVALQTDGRIVAAGVLNDAGPVV